MHRIRVIFPKQIALLLCLIFLAGNLPLSVPDAGPDWEALSVTCYSGDTPFEVRVKSLDGRLYLFLPACADLRGLTVHLNAAERSGGLTLSGSRGSMALRDGDVLDLTALCGEGPYDLQLTAPGTLGAETEELSVSVASGVAAMFLRSQDPAGHGRDWVEASPDKSNAATGSMLLLSPSGAVVYDGDLGQIKGRGNTTWSGVKKPYQLKLDAKTDLLETGDEGNRAKTWLLIANFSDPSLLRNQLALAFGEGLGMEYNIQCRPVELYYDGDYRGSYLLTEKVQVNAGRVDIYDLEGENEDLNEELGDLEALPRETDRTENGASYTYCVGMKTPEDYSGGYLLEMDMPIRAAEEACWFRTSRGSCVVVKSPEFCSREEMDYIASLYQEFEDALYQGGTHPDTGKRYTDYVELTSIAQCYLVNELAKNLDGFRTSAYLYLDRGADRMKMGPLWDYDLAFGVGYGDSAEDSALQDPTGMYTIRSSLCRQLNTQADFRLAVKALYNDILYPLLTKTLPGERDAASGSLRSFAWYRETLADTAANDALLWHGGSADSWNDAVRELERFLTSRAAFLKAEFDRWDGESSLEYSAFLDVEPEAWYYDLVNRANSYGLMSGKTQSIFAPDGTTTRAELVQVLYRMEDPLPETGEPVFRDLRPGAWYVPAVNWAAGRKLVSGDPDGSFHPDQTASRQELAMLLYRYAGAPETDLRSLDRFPDRDEIGEDARPAMAWAVETGLMPFSREETLQPLAAVKRFELAAVMVGFYEKLMLPAP